MAPHRPYLASPAATPVAAHADARPTDGAATRGTAAVDGVTLARRHDPGERRPFLLVHGLASSARLWDVVADRLAAAGHEVLAVDLRGHGRSPDPGVGHDTPTAAADLAALLAAEGLVGGRAPVVAGQSWGGNVVVELAARHGGPAAIVLVDGGWIHLAAAYRDVEACWADLAPPRLGDRSLEELAAGLRASRPGWPEASLAALLTCYVERDGRAFPRLDRGAHRSILDSLYAIDPATRFGAVEVPALLLVAGAEAAAPPPAVARAIDGLPEASVSWYPDGDHDLHAEQPDAVAADLLSLAARLEEGR
ncbi:MAG: alpha/beta hydrolase [Egibacteraceae bacterium]